MFPSIIFVSCFLPPVHLCCLFKPARMRNLSGFVSYRNTYKFLTEIHRYSCFLLLLFSFLPVKEVRLSSSVAEMTFIIFIFPGLPSPNTTQPHNTWSSLYLLQGTKPSWDPHITVVIVEDSTLMGSSTEQFRWTDRQRMFSSSIENLMNRQRCCKLLLLFISLAWVGFVLWLSRMSCTIWSRLTWQGKGLGWKGSPEI